MKLFKEHKINPASGCLPLFIQLPIWAGLFSVLNIAVEFRRSPFILWITDLSQPDRLIAHLPLPFIKELNLLPLLMVFTWYIQMRMSPKPTDPQGQMQFKMMMFMPFVFVIFLYGYASGLSLYFLANALLGIGELKMIKKYFLKDSKSGLTFSEVRR
jgi:YidC/Oxa1 family membrane protein insertase